MNPLSLSVFFLSQSWWCLSEPEETQESPIDEFPCTNSCSASDPEVDYCNSALDELCFTSDDLGLFLSLLLKSLDPSESEVDSCDASDGDGLSFFLGRPDDVSDPSNASYALSFFLGSFYLPNHCYWDRLIPRNLK